MSVNVGALIRVERVELVRPVLVVPGAAVLVRARLGHHRDLQPEAVADRRVEVRRLDAHLLDHVGVRRRREAAAGAAVGGAVNRIRVAADAADHLARPPWSCRRRNPARPGVWVGVGFTPAAKRVSMIGMFEIIGSASTILVSNVCDEDTEEVSSSGDSPVTVIVSADAADFEREGQVDLLADAEHDARRGPLLVSPPAAP